MRWPHGGVHLGLRIWGRGHVRLEDERWGWLLVEFGPQLEERVYFVGPHRVDDRRQQLVNAGILFPHAERVIVLPFILYVHPI